MFPRPPPIVDVCVHIVLQNPPPIAEQYPLDVIVLLQPPLTVEELLLAVLQNPPPTIL